MKYEKNMVLFEWFDNCNITFVTDKGEHNLGIVET